MPLKEMAAATSAWSLTRSLGGSIGLAIFTAVLNTELRSRFESIPGYGTEFEVPQSTEGYAELHDLPDGETKNAVLGAFADSLGVSRGSGSSTSQALASGGGRISSRGWSLTGRSCAGSSLAQCSLPASSYVPASPQLVSSYLERPIKLTRTADHPSHPLILYEPHARSRFLCPP
jgi:hypothetical protein